MHVESSVTSLSWIPSEAVTGANKSAFEIGFTHYDDPPPDVIGDLDEMRDTDAFPLRQPAEGWIEVEGGRIVDAGYGRGGVMGSTTIKFGGKGITFAAVELPHLRDDPVITGDSRDVRADVRRAYCAARAAPRAAAAVRAVSRALGVDDVEAHGALRRLERIRVGGCEHVSPALDLRPRGEALGEGRAR